MTRRKPNKVQADILSDFPTELLETLFMTVDEGIMVTDTAKRILHVNPAFTNVTGYTLDEVSGKTPRILHSDVHTVYFYKNIDEALQKEGKWQGEIWNRRKNGEIYPEFLQIKALHNHDGICTHFVGVFVDLSDHEAALRHLKDAAMTDTLTKVSSRHAFMERMNTLFHEHSVSERMFAILFLDLDRFKQINDTLGHDIGDELLKEFARRLRKLLKNKDMIARIGGDEFVIVLTGLKHSREATIFAERILEKLERPHHIGAYELFISSSIGISFYPADGTTLDELMKKADLAMYESKRQGRNHYTMFYEELESNIARMIQVETALAEAIEERRFSISYIPKLHTKTGIIDGLKTHVVCNSEHYRLEAAQFLPSAEEMGFIVPITNIVIEKICKETKQFQARQIDTGLIAIHIPALYFMQPHFTEILQEKMEAFELSPRLFELEVNEQVIVANGEHSIQKLAKLKSLGFSIVLKEFGNSFTSLSMLSKISIDRICIDSVLIRNLFAADENKILIEMIIQLADRLGIEVDADGVESFRQVKQLKKLGCERVQGDVISQPLAFEQMIGLIELYKKHNRELDLL